MDQGCVQAQCKIQAGHISQNLTSLKMVSSLLCNSDCIWNCLGACLAE